MKRIFKTVVLSVMLLLVTSSIAQEISIERMQQMIEEQKQAIQTLEESFGEKKQAYEQAELEYQKIKSVSRDWNRRNKAEEDFLVAQNDFLKIQKEVLGAIAQLNTLSSNLKLAQTLQANKKRELTSEPQKPKSADSLFNTFINPAVAIILLGLILSFTLIYMDLFKSFIGWFMIRGSKGFQPGDRIEISHIYGDIKGDVIHVGFLRTSLLEVSKEGLSTGNLIFLPNHMILNHPIHKHVKQFTEEKSQIRKVS